MGVINALCSDNALFQSLIDKLQYVVRNYLSRSTPSIYFFFTYIITDIKHMINGIPNEWNLSE